MRRNKEIKIRWYDDEYEVVKAKAAKVPYSREQFCRSILLGSEIKERPPADYEDILRQLRILNSDVYQLLLKAMQTKFIDEVIVQDIYDMTVELDELFGDIFISDKPKRRN